MLGRMWCACPMLLWVFVENEMAPKEVREALGLEEIEKISKAIYR